MTLSIEEYQEIATITDRFEDHEISPILLGLFGEAGSVMSAVKKLKRERIAFIGFENSVVDELGDAFWYFTALVRRLDVSLEQLLAKVLAEGPNSRGFQPTDDPTRPFASVRETNVDSCDMTEALLCLGKATTSLFSASESDSKIGEKELIVFLEAYFQVIASAEISFNRVLSANAEKISDRFVLPKPDELPDFDKSFPEVEQLPRQFEIEMMERENGKVYLRWNGVFIGDPLTDNIREEDGFRYHDVIHFAHAAILHWSPTMRALLKQKRKSKADFDEGEDSGRGSVVEEGLAAWVFSKAKDLDYFEGHDKISIDILNGIKDFVRGYEVEACPASLWEKALLDGYAVFRKMRENRGGVIVGDRKTRTIEYRPIED
ncbi:nucleoside triphosphate pyrophosphohydrolase family protein [Ruegeria sp.]|uniref:nucleoside triphosphate pyrophosphohydrolase family protein n=1 Tax=Ruegeria sp. TaxID=1879320 RepID=UPI0023225F3E|nr:nucleoside triphosphate pyrophosphohydrolase family protein [Ruegeria sp.]MDA7967215.1 nucleoside triphosphate pyrophosphohydrolase family protein [Ruegeria sp.]